MTTNEKILMNLIHCIIGNSWLSEHPEEHYGEFTTNTIKTAFNAGFDSGTFEEFTMDDCAPIYESLTGADWDEFVAESEAQLEAELAMNRAIVGGAL